MDAKLLAMGEKFVAVSIAYKPVRVNGGSRCSTARTASVLRERHPCGYCDDHCRADFECGHHVVLD